MTEAAGHESLNTRQRRTSWLIRLQK
jgi:hypothetical protein